MMQLDQHLEYLHNMRRFETIKLGLTTMENLASALGNPHQKFPSIHIAGTNGKGSTAAFLSHALKENGYRVGLYTSPYLVEFNERIKINNKNIIDQDLIHLIGHTRNTGQKHHIDATFFEFTTALAFQHFANQQVDIAIVETGMGGLLDATNIITPLVSVITNIGTDHQQWLGQSKQDRAKRKAGIIKERVPLVTAEQDPKILKLFQKICQEKNTTLYQIKALPSAKKNRISSSIQSLPTTQSFTYNNQDYAIPLLGIHQITNAQTALRALEVLDSPSVTAKDWESSLSEKQKQSKSFQLSSVKTAHGLSKTNWPGRLQCISQDPPILLDTAHNPEGLQSLIKFLDTNQLPSFETLLLGLKADKQISSEVKNLVSKFKQVITTESTFQPMAAPDLTRQISHPNVTSIQSHKAAFTEALSRTKQGLLLITGSIYLIGNILQIKQEKSRQTSD